MPKLLLPDYIFAKYSDVTPEFLKDLGIKALLIDIDNTLAPYEQPEPDDKIFAWFEALKKNGIRAALISNNGRERVELFNKDLGLIAYYKSGKPFAKNLRRAMKEMGSDTKGTAMLGDQLLTDAAAGKHIGLTTIIVPPINDKRTLFFKMKRASEVGTIKRYVKMHGGESERICSFWVRSEYKRR